MARQSNAGDIINRASVEVGLLKVADPVASTKEGFVQMTELLNSCGQEMVELNEWQILQKPFLIVTQEGDTGTYDLPDDFDRMINQTGWDQTNRVSIGGPLSPQDWSYLEGRDLVSQSIYASFRMVDNKVDLYPQPPPVGLRVRFEYISRDWVKEAGDGNVFKDLVSASTDVVLFEAILMIKLLKAKFLEAKGFDSKAARIEFETLFLARTGQETGAPILNAARGTRGFPYLHPYYSTPDTGFGN